MGAALSEPSESCQPFQRNRQPRAELVVLALALLVCRRLVLRILHQMLRLQSEGLILWMAAWLLLATSCSEKSSVDAHPPIRAEAATVGAQVAQPTSRPIPQPAHWQALDDLQMPHTAGGAALLPSGKVLVVGGYSNFTTGELATLGESFDPSSGEWSLAPGLSVPRGSFGSSTLPDGRVLVAGGRIGIAWDAATAAVEVFDEVSGQWERFPDMPVARFDPFVARLPSGRVLVGAGSNGLDGDGGVGTVQSVYVFDLPSRTWARVPNPPKPFGYGAKAAALPDGRVLVAGGGLSGRNLADVQIFDESTSLWTISGNLAIARQFTDLVVLGSKIMGYGIYGGANASNFQTTEVFGLDTETWRLGRELNATGGSWSLLDQGHALLCGGIYDRGIGIGIGAVSHGRESSRVALTVLLLCTFGRRLPLSTGGDNHRVARGRPKSLREGGEGRLAARKGAPR